MSASFTFERIQPGTGTQPADPAWQGLYKAGGAASLLMVAIILAQFVLFMAWPPPFDGSAGDWFRLFQVNPLRGLLSFELLMVVYMLLSVPVALALYGALRRTSPALTALFVALTLVGVTLFIHARPAFELLALSRQYAAGSSETQQMVFLAAGEALLALFNGTSFHTSYLLGSLQGVIIAWIMLKSRLFSPPTAYLRLASSLFDFGLYVPGIGLFLSMGSVVFLLIWNILVARRLFQLAQEVSLSNGSEIRRK